ncbi:Ig-like domain-containing domain [Bernardetia sp.]|uniref:Ig-like domain-containing domain n=1 Tax=Bernardetia sp. TaxID=1937974 RepID=UPI0025B8518C|nr:Ig-like domain-containing domain [Bernardetia sp.]
MPSGGPKDITPPKLISTYPIDQSTNFNGDIIILEFDEDIATQRLQEELQISPFIDGTYKSTVKRNRLTLKFDQPFAENTTYTFSFGKGVVDFNEKNVPKNIKLAFSTGDKIDSLLITGTVSDLMGGRKLENAMVGLYAFNDVEADSFDITNRRPLYFSLTDSTGRYAIENIKAGNYKVYALAEPKDKRDYVYNKNTEMIGFYEEPLQIGASYSGVDFEVLRYDILPFRVSGARQRGQYFEIKFNKTLADYTIEYQDEGLDKDYDTLFYPVLQEEYINFYNKNINTEDSVVAKMSFTDSIGNTIDTTLTVQFGKVRKLRENAFTMREEPPSATPILPNKELELKLFFNKPVVHIQYDSIVTGFKGDSTGTLTTAADWKFNKNKTELSFIKEIELSTDREKAFQLQIRPNTFVSVENDTLKDAKNLEYTQGAESNYGVISGQVLGAYDNFIIEVLNDKGKVEQTIKNERKYRFENLTKGNKTIRVLVDINANGKWDNGDFENRVLPEPVINLNREIEVKPNWEFEDINIDLGS